MRVTTLKPFSTDPKEVHVDRNGFINPFHQDVAHMGTALGRNVTLLHMNFETDECASFIIVNTRTGERLRVEIETKCVVCSKITYGCGHSITHNGQVCEDCWQAQNGKDSN